MLNHDQLMKTMLVRLEDAVVSYDAESQQAEVVFVDGGHNEEFTNVLASSVLSYQTLQGQRDGLLRLIEMSKEVGADALIPTFELMLNPIELTLEIALNGAASLINVGTQQ